MKRLKPLTKLPEPATLAPEVVLTLARDLLNVFIVFFLNKDPQNPISLNPDDNNDPDTGGGGTDGGMTT